MTSKAKHMARSHRSHQYNASLLSSIGARSHASWEAKTYKKGLAQRLRILTPMVTRLKNLADRLTERFTQAFKKQDRGQ